jgi:hypothetical protein
MDFCLLSKLMHMQELYIRYVSHKATKPILHPNKNFKCYDFG